MRSPSSRAYRFSTAQRRCTKLLARGHQERVVVRACESGVCILRARRRRRSSCQPHEMLHDPRGHNILDPVVAQVLPHIGSGVGVSGPGLIPAGRVRSIPIYSASDAPPQKRRSGSHTPSVFFNTAAHPHNIHHCNIHATYFSGDHGANTLDHTRVSRYTLIVYEPHRGGSNVE